MGPQELTANVERTLLFTDVVDSTQLNEALGDEAMERLWASHDASARELMRKWHGLEIARGDGFFVIFEAARDGVGFAQDYHRAVTSLDPRMHARVGLHTGPVTIRENAAADRALGAPAHEVYGVALSIAARVMSTAQGGQTLLTADVRGKLDPASRARSCGHWRLKGIEEPIELFAMGESSLLLEPPADSVKAYRVVRSGDEWMPARKIAHSLPADRDAFVGRADVLATLADLLEGKVRLVTLLGIGGIGKTRLALRYARTWLGDYEGGAWFCDLSTARSVDGIVHAVAQALDIALGRSDPVQQIAAAVQSRGHALVVLDNFEQVASHAEATLGVWLQRAPHAQFLVTSREVLGIPGEHALAMQPLPVGEGAELFRMRAKAASRRVAAESSSSVERLVALLDGLPLAIELAAARSRIMPPAVMLDRMHERFTLLASRGGRLDRQATLRATFDWSWDLLAPHERSALAQLSVFEGGFTLDAAESVVDLAALPEAPPVVDVVQSLVEKSLVREGAGQRFDMLVSVHEYSATRLTSIAPADARRRVELRHCEYYTGNREGERATYAMGEIDNLSAACRRAVARGAVQDATNALEMAWAGLKIQGPLNAALELAAAIRSSGHADMRASARLCRVAGSALHALGQVDEAQREFEAGLDQALALRDFMLEAQLRCQLGDLHANAGQTEKAGAYLDAALAIAERVADHELRCTVHNSLGSLHESLGRLDVSLGHYEAALAIAKASGNRRWEAGSLGNLAQLHATRGDHRKAEALYEEAISIARALHDRRWEGNALCNLGITYQALGKLAEAREKLGQALSIARDLGNRRLEAVTLCNLGIVADSMGEHAEARAAFERAITVARVLRDRRSEGQFLTYLGWLDGRLGDCERARSALASAESLLESVSDRLSLGLLLSCRAEVELLAGDATAAREILCRAEALALELEPAPGSEFGLAIARARRAIA